MPKQRSPDRDKAFQIYKEHNGNIPLVDIAAQLSISEGTVRGWKNKDKWDSQLNGTFQKRSNKNTERSKHNDKKLNEKLLETVESNTDLTEKQKLFCFFYVKRYNATQAAINAGYSPDTAGQQGYNLLQREDVKEEIQRLKLLKHEAIICNKDDVIERYMNIAFSDMNDFVNFGTEEFKQAGKNGEKQKYQRNFVKFKNSTVVDGSLISEISVGKNGSKVKLEDRQKALDWLAKYFVMNPLDKHKIEYENKKLEYEQMKSNTNNSDNSNMETKVTIYIPDNKRDSDA